MPLIRCRFKIVVRSVSQLAAEAELKAFEHSALSIIQLPETEKSGSKTHSSKLRVSKVRLASKPMPGCRGSSLP
jgi:hypothetical protein